MDRSHRLDAGYRDELGPPRVAGTGGDIVLPPSIPLTPITIRMGDTPSFPLGVPSNTPGPHPQAEQALASAVAGGLRPPHELVQSAFRWTSGCATSNILTRAPWPCRTAPRSSRASTASSGNAAYLRGRSAGCPMSTT